VNKNSTFKDGDFYHREVKFQHVFYNIIFIIVSAELPLIKQACKICQATSTLQLLNLGYTFKHHLKPLVSRNWFMNH